MNGSPEAQKCEDAHIVNPITGTKKKACSKCGIVKPYNDFAKDKRNVNNAGIGAQCKKCKQAISRKWWVDNPDKSKNYSRDWRSANFERSRAIGRKAKAKRSSTIPGRISNSMSSMILYSLKNGDGKRRKHWEDIVGFTSLQLKKHLERKFSNGMRWDNYGKYWEIDHIIPIKAFNFQSFNDIDFKKCWSLTNLQPLEKIKNKIKSDNVVTPYQPSLLISAKSGLERPIMLHEYAKRNRLTSESL